MKLYEIPKKSKIYCECEDKSNFIIFEHLDGFYSYCKTEKGGIVHLGACQELVKFNDGFKLFK